MIDVDTSHIQPVSESQIYFHYHACRIKYFFIFNISQFITKLILFYTLDKYVFRFTNNVSVLMLRILCCSIIDSIGNLSLSYDSIYSFSVTIARYLFPRLGSISVGNGGRLLCVILCVMMTWSV